MKNRIKIIATLVFVLGLQQFSGFARMPEAVKNLETAAQKTTEFFGRHRELARLLGCATQVPQIFFSDSENPAIIRATAGLAGLPIAINLLYELIRTRQQTMLAKEMIWDVPKVSAYTLAGGYDFLSFVNAGSITHKNKTNGKSLKSFKINQYWLLMLEVALRVCAYMSTIQCEEVARKNNQSFIDGVSGVADLIEIWRLLSRYYSFKLPKMIEGSLHFELKTDDGEQGTQKFDMFPAPEIQGYDSLELILEEKKHEKSNQNTEIAIVDNEPVIAVVETEVEGPSEVLELTDQASE